MYAQKLVLSGGVARQGSAQVVTLAGYDCAIVSSSDAQRCSSCSLWCDSFVTTSMHGCKVHTDDMSILHVDVCFFLPVVDLLHIYYHARIQGHPPESNICCGG